MSSWMSSLPEQPRADLILQISPQILGNCLRVDDSGLRDGVHIPWEMPKMTHWGMPKS